MSLVGHRAQNHPQQVGANGARDDVDDRRTPPDLLAECAALAGVESYSFDVAANAENAKAPDWYGIDDDGLARDWYGDVWCNPPYSDIEPWVRKAHAESQHCRSISMLLPANRTEQGWWQDLVEPYRAGKPRAGVLWLGGVGTLEVHFLRGRRRFDRPGWTKPAKGDRPPFGLCLLVWSAP